MRFLCAGGLAAVGERAPEPAVPGGDNAEPEVTSSWAQIPGPDDRACSAAASREHEEADVTEIVIGVVVAVVVALVVL